MRHPDPCIQAWLDQMGVQMPRNPVVDKPAPIPHGKRRLRPSKKDFSIEPLYADKSCKKPRKAHEWIDRACLRCQGAFKAPDRYTRLCSENCRHDNGGIGPMGGGTGRHKQGASGA